MEINTQQIESLLHLQEQQATLPKKGVPANGFNAVLKSQLSDSEQVAMPQAEPALTGAALYSQILLQNPVENNIDPDAGVMEAAMDQASSTLDLWDNYSRVLSQSNSASSLKDAFSLLEGIDTQIAQLRSSPAMGKSAVFDGMVNELEILAATEKFKFNRGDYLA